MASATSYRINEITRALSSANNVAKGNGFRSLKHLLRVVGELEKFPGAVSPNLSNSFKAGAGLS